MRREDIKATLRKAFGKEDHFVTWWGGCKVKLEHQYGVKEVDLAIEELHNSGELEQVAMISKSYYWRFVKTDALPMKTDEVEAALIGKFSEPFTFSEALALVSQNCDHIQLGRVIGKMLSDNLLRTDPTNHVYWFPKENFHDNRRY